MEHAVRLKSFHGKSLMRVKSMFLKQVVTW